MSWTINNPEMVTVFRNETHGNVTVFIEFWGVGIPVSPHKTLTPGDTLSVPKVSVDGCVVVLVSA